MAPDLLHIQAGDENDSCEPDTLFYTFLNSAASAGRTSATSPTMP